MKLTLSGHDYKFAVEQIMILMFPEERPHYTNEDASDLATEVTLTYGNVYVSAVTHIRSGHNHFHGTSRLSKASLTDKLTADRLLQRTIKLSFYKAAVAATGKKPVWGALTGIRPGKIVTGLLEHGLSEKKALGILEHSYFVTPERGRLCVDTSKAGLRVKKTLNERDVALYIGIPFCPTRCHYCSFVSHSVEKSIKLIPPFLDALYKEIEATAEIARLNRLNILSVYIGGGTPTTLSAEQLHILMTKLGTFFDLSSVREYTVEAGRPDTITKEKLEELRSSGATRISINPQTMSDTVLKAIGRNHTAEDVLRAMQAARQTGFNLINMDLIAGLPGDTPDSFKASLDSVLALGPENITVHTLSLKKGTRVKLENMDIPDGQAVAMMLDHAEMLLRSNGYLPYYLYRQKFMSGGFENVGWCRPGSESLYNILIMEELATILAMGGGGATKLVGPKSSRIERIFNPKYPYEYIGNIDRVIDSKTGITHFCSDPQNFSQQ